MESSSYLILLNKIQLNNLREKFLSSSFMFLAHGLNRTVSRHLVRMCFLVVALVHCEEVFKLPLERLERRSTHRVFVPTLEHDFVESWVAVRWHWHSVTMLNLTKDFSVCHTWKSRSKGLEYEAIFMFFGSYLDKVIVRT